MMATAVRRPVSTKIPWPGAAVTALVSLFLLFDAVIHLMKIAPVVDAFARLGIPLGLAAVLGVVELACVLLYVYPRTAMTGAILLTGYLGGAVLTHLRAGSSLFGETLFPVYVGILVWGGLYLRESRLRALITSSSEGTSGHRSRAMVWAGRIAIGLSVLMMLLAAVMKLVNAPGVADGFRESGLAENLVVVVGTIELICTVAYALPWTRFWGAILMTGLLGGAIFTNLRVGNAAWPLPAVLAVLAWAGLFWSDGRVRELIPFRD